jgi:murein DD-endopeptidase MepM/ murein hydrolase activator NlpD
MRKYLAAELDALDARQRALEDERANTMRQLAATESDLASEQRHLDELIRTEYRQARRTPLEEILAGGSIIDGLVRVAELSEIETQRRESVARLSALRADLADERAKLERDAAEVAALTETIAAKRDAVATLEARAQRLVDAQGKGDAARTRAEVEVVAELADDQARASQELLDVVAKLVPNAPSGRLAWTWPAAGVLSQGFGPSTLGLEPPLLYRGVTYPHFHPAIDVAAPLFTPVVAAAPGRVSFVGHFSDGAMIVLIVHADGFVTMYAHLDDAVRPPTVHVGDTVTGGQVIGVIGLTGITTGAHLHFAVLQGTVPVDPLTILPPR